MQRETRATELLLGPRDPDPVVIHGETAPFLLTVEHAGRHVPESMANLGLPSEEIDRHIGWDIGAYELALAMAERMPSVVVAQRYSRLVIDANRPWDADDLVPAVSDGTRVPSNAGLDLATRRKRWDEIHRPFHDALSAFCDGSVRALIAVHTYDPQRQSDRAMRPWPIGLLWRRDNSLAEGLAARLPRDEATLPLGINEPYEIEDSSDFTIPVHAEPRHLPHVLVEVRNDFVRDADGVARFASILARACLELEV